LVEIGKKNRDIQAIIQAHRILHDLDGYVFNRPKKGGGLYGAARSAKGANPSLLNAIATYIEKNRNGTA
jgi:hypothetical protein